MIYPNLIFDFARQTQCHVILQKNTPDQFGNYEEIDKGVLCGKYKDISYVKEDDKHSSVRITGTIKFDGDIAPELSVIAGGYVEIFGDKRNIVKGSKKRNFDGSVNYTNLEIE